MIKKPTAQFRWWRTRCGADKPVAFEAQEGLITVLIPERRQAKSLCKEHAACAEEAQCKACPGCWLHNYRPDHTQARCEAADASSQITSRSVERCIYKVRLVAIVCHVAPSFLLLTKPMEVPC